MSLRDDALAIGRAALRGADPALALQARARCDGDTLVVDETRLPLRGRVVLLGAGKAAARAAGALARILGDRLDGGVVVVPHELDVPPGLPVEVVRAGHPLPDAGSVLAAARLSALADGLGPDDTALVVITGGSSALLGAPLEGLSLPEAQQLSRALLRSGLDIGAMNTVRRHVSALGGGRLSAALHPCPHLVLVASDVPGDDPSVIGSGPACGDPTTWADTADVLERVEGVPGAAHALVRRGLAGEVPDTVRPGAIPLARQQLVLLTGPATTAAAAAREAQRRGYTAEIVTTRLSGAARAVGATTARAARELAPRHARVYAGETEVDVGDAPGLGGRNQEVALAAARELDGAADAGVLALGTDGIDGPTDAAGAFVDGTTAAALHEAGIDLDDALARHDSHPALDAVGALVRTGPTGVNAADLVVALRA